VSRAREPGRVRAAAGTTGRLFPTIVCLCGSTRFAETFNRVAHDETLAGRIVLRPEVVAHGAERDPQRVVDEVKARLDELHLRKIDLADEVLILNVGGYMGESARRELAHARARGRHVRFLQDPGPEGRGLADAYPHVWWWRCRLPERRGQRCRVTARGTLNSIRVEFSDGHWVVTSRRAVRRAP
jgi:hypothetical protein